MRRIGPEELRCRALRILEQLAEESRAGPVERTVWLRFVLAYLFSTSHGGRAPFDWFWVSLAEENAICRSQNVQASLNAIRQAVSPRS